MKYYEIDKTHFPVVIVRFNSNEVTLKEHTDFLNSQIELLQQYPGISMVFDLTRAKALSSELRIQQGNWNKKNGAFLKAHMKGIAFVHQSVIMTFVFKGIFLIQKPTVPYTVVSTLKEGLEWANALSDVNKVVEA